MNSEGLAKRSRDEREVTAAQKEEVPASEGRASVRSRRDKGRGRGAGMGKGVKSLLVAASLPLILGILDILINSPDNWYMNLQKPSWHPPPWLFSTFWCLFYPIMGLASWLVWADGGFSKNPYPLGLYITQLLLNLLWLPFLFRFHRPGLALVDISLLLLTLLMCYKEFKHVNHVASDLVIPYLAWIFFASALNLSLWNLNSGWERGTLHRASFD